jgi:hypothetical protein
MSCSHRLGAIEERNREGVLKKTITYEDFNGDTVIENFYFHLSKAELVELELGYGGEGLAASLQKIIDAEDAKGIIEQFKIIILTAYGKRSEDGKRFIKNQELRDEFVSTEAYSVLFMELATNTGAAIEFINGIIPAGMAEEAAKLRQAQVESKTPENAAVVALPADVDTTKAPDTPETPTEPRIVTKEEVAAMSDAEVVAFGRDIDAGKVKLAE